MADTEELELDDMDLDLDDDLGGGFEEEVDLSGLEDELGIDESDMFEAPEVDEIADVNDDDLEGELASLGGEEITDDAEMSADVDIEDDLDDMEGLDDMDASLDDDMDMDAGLDDMDASLDDDMGSEMDDMDAGLDDMDASLDDDMGSEMDDMDASLDDDMNTDTGVDEFDDVDEEVTLDASMQIPDEMADAGDLLESEEDDFGSDDMDEDAFEAPEEDAFEAPEEDYDMGDMDDEEGDLPADDDDPFAMPTPMEDGDDDQELTMDMDEDDLALDDAMMDDDDYSDDNYSNEYDADDGATEAAMDVDLSYSEAFESPPETSYKIQAEEKLIDQGLLNRLPHLMKVEVGQANLKGEDITNLTYGSIIELDRKAGDPVDIVLGGEVVAKGEVVRINEDQLGVRITRINL
ncbi:MAG: FliM/FliN family flagellar motor switch protein [SAR324 cluster bacterium]|nr:FliM/FliN family flagellar motor switch protein [SAR324 cluster bacterium]